jgi:hypothetical protein
VTARADRSLVRFYVGQTLVKTHPRMAPGQRSTDPSDFPPEKAAYAMRDVAFLSRKAGEHGAAVGRFADKLLAGPLPWTRMRRAYALLGLARRYGSARVEEACTIALDADMIDVQRLRKLLEIAAQPPSPHQPAPVIPLARYLRPPEQYALPLVKTEKGDKA